MALQEYSGFRIKREALTTSLFRTVRLGEPLTVALRCNLPHGLRALVGRRRSASVRA